MTQTPPKPAISSLIDPLNTSPPQNHCVAITGASGFLGQYVSKELHSAGYTARALTRRPISTDKSSMTVDYGDIKSLTEALSGCSAVIHLAGLAHTRQAGTTTDQSRIFTEAVFDTTQNLFRAAKLCGIEKFVYASTIKVYGDTRSGVLVDKNSPPNPIGPYAEAKLRTENFLLATRSEPGSNAHDIQVWCLRFPPMYGRGMKNSVRHLFRAAEWGIPLPIGNLLACRAYLYGGNAARVCVGALRGRVAPGVTVPFDGGCPTLAEFYDAIVAAYHPTVRTAIKKLSLSLPGLGILLSKFGSTRSMVEELAVSGSEWDGLFGCN